MKGDVASIVLDARAALQDDGTRWSDADLAGYLTEAQKALLLARPEEGAAEVKIVTVEGAAQPLPENAMTLLAVRRLLDGKGTALSIVQRASLEAVMPQWESVRLTTQIKHYMYDRLNPRAFYLYPPAAANVHLEVVYTRYPDVVPESLTGSTSVEAKWDPALLAYVLYRAWMKDAEYAGRADVASSYLQVFAAATAAQPAAS